MLTRVKVEAFDLHLRLFDRTADHPVFKRHVFRQLKYRHKPRDLITAKQTHDVIF